MLRNFRSFRFATVFVLAHLAISSNPVFAADGVNVGQVVIESEGVSISTLDLEAELNKAPPDVRNSLLFRKEGLAQLASNLLMRRVLAKQAEATAVSQTPLNQAALQIARDRVMSDLQLQTLDQINKLSASVIEQRARDTYRAESKRFEIAEEVKASHILVLLAADDAEEKARIILNEIKSGKDFADLAKEKSQDPGSGAKGGDLGFFARGSMVKEFEEAAFKMKVGELSDVVKSQFGYHIIKVTDRKEAGKQSFEQVRETLVNEVQQKILTEGRMKAGEQIMSKAKPYPENLDAFIANQAKK